MGQGVTQTLVQDKHQVYLIDRQFSLTQGAIRAIRKKIHMDTMFGTSMLTEDVQDIIARVHPMETLEFLSDVDVIIENITEDVRAKEDLYQSISKFINKSCILLANTSCISITELASHVSYPENVIGAHFMNPVPQIGAVELIRGFHTSQDTIDATIDLLLSIGKKSILVDDLPGFVSNRISHLMMNEAAFIVQEQVASAEKVDAIFRECYGHKMGPLELADLIGLDTVVLSLKVLYDSYQDSKFRCCPLLAKMVSAGLLGKKTGRGFYTY